MPQATSDRLLTEFMDRTRDCDRDDRFGWYTMRETGEDVKIQNNGRAELNDTAEFNMESVN